MPLWVLRVECAGGGARVVVVETRTFEDDANRIEELSKPAAARFADLQWVVRKRLMDVELVAAFGATVRIGGHAGPPGRANLIRRSRILRVAPVCHAIRFKVGMRVVLPDDDRVSSGDR